MKHPYIVNANANERFNRMVAEAENQRMVKRTRGSKTGLNILKSLTRRFQVSKSRRLDESANSPA